MEKHLEIGENWEKHLETQAGWGFEQTGLEGGVLAHSWGVGTG